MAWKISKITMANFKVFHEAFEFEPESMNVLMHGENGSGKSSIYWAAYTHFQSALKLANNQDTKKYFMPDHSERLRNIYLGNEEDSFISIKFIDDNKVEKTYTDGQNLVNTWTSTDSFMTETLYASDFMNYKFLSSMFDFKNSKEVDVFDMFSTDIFPFMQLGKECYRIEDGENNGNDNASFWWGYIKSIYNDGKKGILPTHQDAGNTYTQNIPIYRMYVTLIQDFNTNLEKQLERISYITNVKLKEIFGLPIEIDMDLKYASFNKKIGNRKYDGKLHNPKILLKAKITDPDIPIDSNREIEHPGTFFNEARLTCIALAIRLAIIELRYRSDSCAQVLFVDDLLVSMDMAHRKPIVDILLNLSNTHQLIWFTHDRSFYDFIAQRITIRNSRSDWKFLEMYVGDKTITGTTMPTPILKIHDTYIDRAKQYLSTCDFPAAASMLRKCCEHQLNRLLPYSWQLDKNSDGASKIAQLSNLMDLVPRFIAYYDLPNLTPNLRNYRKQILNPSAHDDVLTPLYKDEIVSALDEISILPNLVKNELVTYSECGKKEYSMEIEKDGIIYDIVFMFVDVLSRISYNEKSYYGNPRVIVKYKSDNVKGIGLNSYQLKNLKNRLCDIAGVDSELIPLDKIVSDRSTGMCLSDM